MRKTISLIVVSCLMLGAVGCHGGDQADFNAAKKAEEDSGAIVLDKSPVGGTDAASSSKPGRMMGGAKPTKQ